MREASLKVSYDKGKKLFYYSLSPKDSDTGKRQRVHFKDERAAKDEIGRIKKERELEAQIIRRNSTERIRDLLQWDEEMKAIYGVAGGLEFLYSEFKAKSQAEHESRKFGELCSSFEKARCPNWSKKSISSWKWLRRIVEPMDNESILKLDLGFWEKWTGRVTVERNLSPRSVKDVLSRLSSVWEYGVQRELVDRNPIKGVVRPKVRPKKPDVLSIDEVRSVMDCAWKFDREIVPYFALAIFAGLRPDYAKDSSEITKLVWDDVNFETREVRVGANLDNKTETKRYVEMQPNLVDWISDWKGKSGSVCPSNLRRRVRKVLTGEYFAAEGSSKEDFIPLIATSKSRQDIFRHTFGSFFAVGRTRDQVREVMGHTNDKTFQQFYRNAQSPTDAQAFWDIRPPKD